MKRHTRSYLSSLALLGVAAASGCQDRSPTTVDSLPSEAALTVANGRLEGPGHFAPGRLVVRFAAGSLGAAADGRDGLRTASLHGARPARRLTPNRTWLLDVPAGRELAIARELARNPDVELVEPDWLLSVQPCGVGECERPSTPVMGSKWELHNDGTVSSGGTLVPTGKADADIDWLEAYDHLGAGFGGSAVVAILDTGIRKTHQDLAGKVIGERNFVDPARAADASDDSGHGTKVAGIVAGHGGDGTGMLGVAYAPNVRLLAAKVCDARGSCPSSYVASAIMWAADNGANVINMSFSGDPRAVHGSSFIREALAYARARNVLPVCATGNDGFGAISYPARFADCVAVGATNWSDGRPAYSNHGSGIDFAAPGGEQDGSMIEGMITSITHESDTGYAYSTGTSLAAPQVSGLAALLFASGITDANEIEARLRGTTDDLGAQGYDEEYGHGRINAYRALTGRDPETPPTAVPGSEYSADEGALIRFDGSASFDPNGKALRYRWTFGDGHAAEGARPGHAYADDGTYTVSLEVTDPSGLSHTAEATATIANVAPSVSAALRHGSIRSGDAAELGVTFADPGADAPWSYTIHSGEGTGSGILSSASEEIGWTHRFCSVGPRTIGVAVTDKDGATGTASVELTVSRIRLEIVAPESIRRRAGSRWLDVTVLGTPTFDVGTLDVASITLGDGSGAEAPLAVRENGRPRVETVDVNADGTPDLVARFEREQVDANGDLKEPAVRLVLRASLTDGCRQVEGAREVQVSR